MQQPRGFRSSARAVAAIVSIALVLGGSATLAVLLDTNRTVDVPRSSAHFDVPLDWRVYGMPTELGLPASPSSPLRATVALNAESPYRTGACSLFVYEAEPQGPIALADEVRGWYEGWVLDHVRSGAVSPALEHVVLPCGEAFHAYWSYDAGVRGARYGHVYHFEDGGSLYRVACWSARPRSDAWRPLVESVRFISEEA